MLERHSSLQCNGRLSVIGELLKVLCGREKGCQMLASALYMLERHSSLQWSSLKADSGQIERDRGFVNISSAVLRGQKKGCQKAGICWYLLLNSGICMLELHCSLQCNGRLTDSRGRLGVIGELLTVVCCMDERKAAKC